MEQTELIKIVVAAVVTIIVRELLTSIVAQSKALAKMLTKHMSAFLITYWRLILGIFDCVILIFIVYTVLQPREEHSIPASRAFVAQMSFFAMAFCVSLLSVVFKAKRFIEETERMKKTEPNK